MLAEMDGRRAAKGDQQGHVIPSNWTHNHQQHGRPFTTGHQSSSYMSSYTTILSISATRPMENSMSVSLLRLLQPETARTGNPGDRQRVLRPRCERDVQRLAQYDSRATAELTYCGWVLVVHGDRRITPQYERLAGAGAVVAPCG